MFEYIEPELESKCSEKKLITNFVFLMISDSQEVLDSGLFVSHRTTGAAAKMMVDISGSISWAGVIYANILRLNPKQPNKTWKVVSTFQLFSGSVFIFSLGSSCSL